MFNGKRTIVLVSDNNFTPAQLTQFIALEISSGLLPALEP
jgi:hypothetical protein